MKYTWTLLGYMPVRENRKAEEPSYHDAGLSRGKKSWVAAFQITVQFKGS